MPWTCTTLHTHFIILEHVALTSYNIELFQVILTTLGYPMLITLIFKFAAPSAVLETIDALAVEFWLHYIPNDCHGELGPFCISVSGRQRIFELTSCAYQF